MNNLETPNSKQQKYDRQLSWNRNAEKYYSTRYFSLTPGIGSYCIIDHKEVTGEAAGNNFFLEHGHIGKSKAECVAKLLNELNPEVRGSSISKDPSTLIRTEPDIFKKFTHVIVSELAEADLMTLSEICWGEKIPLAVVRTYGFLGFMHLVFPEHAVIEVHPESNIDLRLDCPWPELAEFAENHKMDPKDSMALTHTPFPVILLKAAKLWKSKIPADVQSYLNDSVLDNLHGNASEFWILLKALKSFIENEGNGSLPLPGSVPDMKADTESYVTLQKLFHHKAEADKQCLKNYVATICSTLKRTMLNSEIIDIFCKNSGYIKLFRTNSLKAHMNSSPEEEFKNAAKNDENQLHYLILRTADRFKALHGRFPGTVEQTFASDLVAFEALFDTFLKEVGILDVQYHTKVKEM
ncbi:NEDD8-activating enzyme E1 regulatory subunit [Terramyces sp. JEL0728]|nr:NEDD8-activating enzyme E1 regulatory subunit [Terramyces sp. JEL0728]